MIRRGRRLDTQSGVVKIGGSGVDEHDDRLLNDDLVLNETPIVTLSDGLITLRTWTGDDASFMVKAFADPEIRRYNSAHDRLGHPDPPL